MSIFARVAKNGIVHGFAGTIDDARQYRARGFWVSVNKRYLPALEPVLPLLNIDELVLETDSAEPAGVAEVCREVAALKQATGRDVENATTANVVKLLGKSRS